MKIRTKIAKLQMHENFHEFLLRAIKATNAYTAIIASAFQSILKWQSSSLRLHQIFPIMMINFFSKFNRPLVPNPEFEKGRKIPAKDHKLIGKQTI